MLLLRSDVPPLLWDAGNYFLPPTVRPGHRLIDGVRLAVQDGQCMLIIRSSLTTVTWYLGTGLEPVLDSSHKAALHAAATRILAAN